MLNHQAATRPTTDCAPDATAAPAGVTAYVVDAPEVLDTDHPLLSAITELGATALRSANDLSVLVVVQKASGSTGSAR